MMKASLVVAALVLVVASACSRTTAPAAPSAAAVAASDLLSGDRLVGLTGYIRGLDLRNRSFTLVLASSTAATVRRGDTTAVRTDDTTEIWVKGQRARFGALQNGMLGAVRGTDHGVYVVARTISSR
ncbi:MAG: hypothetical protein ACE148_15830 [Vicinamibacterales bacterium]